MLWEEWAVCAPSHKGKAYSKTERNSVEFRGSMFLPLCLVPTPART